MKRWVRMMWLFAFAFAYMFAASVILREIIIPEVFPQSANGHQPGDPSFYDLIAKRNVDNLMEGKAKLSFSPHGQTVSGIASFIYAYGGSIYSLVLLNCILHGASVVILFLILRNWFSGLASTVGVMPLLISPYMILWFSQINKGSWTLFGVLLFTYGFIKFLSLFAMSIPFLGALYRYRYPWWILLIGLGLAACSDLLGRRSVAAKQKRVT
ncbi:MAG: hypothetical protein P8N92_06680 [Burkholderiales bacterium]|nr:hypothetical protein [Burkholderiales bacterium]